MLTNLLLENKNSILILEDAEKAILNRNENNESSLVSSLLNISDGIFQVLGSTGNTHLGGTDFDNQLYYSFSWCIPYFIVNRICKLQ